MHLIPSYLKSEDQDDAHFCRGLRDITGHSSDSPLCVQSRIGQEQGGEGASLQSSRAEDGNNLPRRHIVPVK